MTFAPILFVFTNAVFLTQGPPPPAPPPPPGASYWWSGYFSFSFRDFIRRF